MLIPNVSLHRNYRGYTLNAGPLGMREVVPDMMTDQELIKYWQTPGPKRDRKAFARDQLERARFKIEQLRSDAAEVEQEHPTA